MNPIRASPSPFSARLRPIALLSLSLSLGLSLASLYLAPAAVHEPIWKNYRILLMDANVPEADVLAAIGAGGYSRVVSFSTQPVQLSDWVRLESVTLAASLQRLVPGDPRRDPYLESLADWFKAEVDGLPFRVFYLPSTSPFFSMDGIRQALSPFFGRFLLPDSERGRVEGGAERSLYAVISTLILAIAAFSGSFSPNLPFSAQSPRKILLRISLAAPWIPFSALGLSSAVIAVVWACALIDSVSVLDLPVEEYCRSKNWRLSLAGFSYQRKKPFALLAVAIVTTILNAQACFSIAVALSASLASFIFTVSIFAKQLTSRLRFVPRPLASLKVRKKKNDWVGAALVIAVMVFGFATRYLDNKPYAKMDTRIELPLPRAISGSLRPNPAESFARIASKKVETLPDLASWLAHRAIQEAIPLSRLGDLRKDPFASVLLPSMEANANKLDFSEEWAEAAYRSIPPTSVEDMLLAQGRAVVAIPGNDFPRNKSPLAPIESLLYIFLLIPPLWRVIAGLPVARSSVSGKLRQEA